MSEVFRNYFDSKDTYFHLLVHVSKYSEEQHQISISNIRYNDPFQDY